MPTDNWDNAQEVKLTNELSTASKRECLACFAWFTTTSRYAQRCPPCKKSNAPKSKKIINPNLAEPF